jgi:Rrf2 family protein
MALMNRKVEYALLILSYLHRRPDGSCAREIAGWFGLSRAFVANILKALCHQGYVTSRRGVKGGYVLARLAEEINLADLLESFDNTFRFADWHPTDENTQRAVCPVKGLLAEVHYRVREVMRGITLADLFRPALPADDLQVGLDLVSIIRG